MNTLQKRTFGDGSYLELFQRKDGTHRIKYVAFDGDEICLNLATKGWCRGTEFNDYNELFEIGRLLMSERKVCSSDDSYFGMHVAAALLAKCGSTVKEAARVYGQHPETARVWFEEQPLPSDIANDIVTDEPIRGPTPRP